MTIQTVDQTPAQFLRAQGWGVGDTLLGEQIIKNGRVFETPRLLIITAVGESMVLARSYWTDGRQQRGEHAVHFSARHWSKTNYLRPASPDSSSTEEKP